MYLRKQGFIYTFTEYLYIDFIDIDYIDIDYKSIGYTDRFRNKSKKRIEKIHIRVIKF